MLFNKKLQVPFTFAFRSQKKSYPTCSIGYCKEIPPEQIDPSRPLHAPTLTSYITVARSLAPDKNCRQNVFGTDSAADKNSPDLGCWTPKSKMDRQVQVRRNIEQAVASYSSCVTWYIRSVLGAALQVRDGVLN